MTFTVAIIGRPNVGKSTLFNRLVGKRLALVDDTPGVTRDRREGMGRIGDLSFRVIDTAGLEDAFDDSLEARMRQQTEQAIAEADVALMLIDARAGVTPLDEHFANWVRREGRPVVLVANKCEGVSGTQGVYDAYALGLGEPLAVSAEHGEGMGELIEVLDGETIHSEFLKTHGEGLHHIGFRVPDVDAVVGPLEERGVGVVQSAFREGARYAYMDPAELGGIMLEFVQRAGE